MNIVDVLEHFYIERGAARYETGGPKGRNGVTQLQHALQCATLAARAQAPDTLVTAALLHDLGHLLYEQADHQMGTGQDDVHQYLALPFLRPYFGPAVLEPIKLHVDAKRWLCATEPAYWAALSAGSRRSLALQGGPFDGDESRAFMALPFAEEAVRLRRWDDQAKDPARDLRAFSAWRDLLERVAVRRWPPTESSIRHTPCLEFLRSETFLPHTPMKPVHSLLASAAIALFGCTGHAAPAFVNGLVLDGAGIDASGGTVVNDGRLGYFSDIYYDPRRKEWWALSDRGPGGGTLNYETRVHRFKLDVNPSSGEISNFQVLKTLIFRKRGSALNGLAPTVAGPLGVAFDPEGIVVDPRTGHLLVSDEYGPSLYEINGSGQVVHTYQTPANLLPRDAATGATNFASDAGNTAGKRVNRGFEGLAISPDGRYAYAMLQSAMLDEGAGNGVYNRIVKFDTRTHRAVAQFAYRMDGSSQGRGISALVALNNTDFLVLERNNRGLGVDAELSPPNKKVFRISLSGASDVSSLDLDAPGVLFAPVAKEAAPWLDLAQASTLSDVSLAALGGVSPEKWEGLTIGPQLKDGSYLVLAGTDNDYSVTQNGTGTQFDVYFKPNGATPSRIQCDIGGISNCIAVKLDGSRGDALPVGFDFGGYKLIPGVLHAYKASAADLAGLVRPGGDHRCGRGDERPSDERDGCDRDGR